MPVKMSVDIRFILWNMFLAPERLQSKGVSEIKPNFGVRADYWVIIPPRKKPELRRILEKRGVDIILK